MSLKTLAPSVCNINDTSGWLGYVRIRVVTVGSLFYCCNQLFSWCFLVLLYFWESSMKGTCSFEHRQQNPGAWEVQIWFITIPRKLGSIIPYIYNKWPRCWSLLNAGCFENYPLALFTQLLHLLLAYPTHQLKKQQDHQHTKITKGLALQVFLGEPLAVFSHAELRPDCVTVTWGLGVKSDHYNVATLPSPAKYPWRSFLLCERNRLTKNPFNQHGACLT